jgi:hypothetical protein
VNRSTIGCVTLRCRVLVGVFVLLVATGGAAASGADQTITPRLLVLQPADVGVAYVKNTAYSRPRTLQDAASGDSASIRRRLQKVWVGGYQVGFNGRKVDRGIVSTADVFRNTTLADIERAWTADSLALTHGRALTVPAGAPGSFRLLVLGKVQVGAQPVEVLLYMWQQGRVVASVNVTGTQNSFSTALLMRLAAQQDKRIRDNLRQ